MTTGSSAAERSDRLCLVLPSSFDSLERLVEAFEGFLAERLGDEELAYRVLLLASEGVTNAIEHGNLEDPSKMVHVDCRVKPDCVMLRIEDEGAGFEPQAIASPLDPDNLMRDGGRGIYLMEEMADEVQYSAEGRCLELIFRRQP